SQQLSALERQLGTSLLERSNRGVTLTVPGARLSERASDILDLVQSATAEAVRAGLDAGPVPLRVGAFPTAITTILAPAMPALAPLVDLTIVHLEPRQALDELVARGLAAAIGDRYADQPGPDRPGLHVMRLLTDRLRVAVRSDRTQRDVTALAALPWVLAGAQSGLGRNAAAALRSVGITSPSVRVE